MRLVMFVAIGIAVGVVAARIGTGDQPPRTVATPAGPGEAAPARPAPTRPGPVREVERIRQRELEPSDPRYDPVSLMRQEDGLSAKDIFEREPRDPVFAPVLEQRAGAALERARRSVAIRTSKSPMPISSTCTIGPMAPCSGIARRRGWPEARGPSQARDPLYAPPSGDPRRCLLPEAARRGVSATPGEPQADLPEGAA